MTTSTAPSPLERIRRVYESEPCARTFEEDLWLHLAHGYVHSTPGLFVMGRPVRRQADYRDITNPAHRFTDPDSWWIHAAAGDVALLPVLLPYHLPWIGWERSNIPRFHLTERVLKLCETNPLLIGRFLVE